MIGQGRPNRAFRQTARRPLAGVWRWFVAALAAWALAAGTTQAGDVHVRLRLEWGGPVPRRWQGTIQASSGTLENPRALGVDADEPGSIWAEAGQVLIRSPSPRAYDGVDITVHAPLSARLTVQLTSADQRADTSLAITLADVLDEYRTYSLDNQGTQLLARRAPGDKLQVHLARDNLVFAPGDSVELEAQPNVPALPPGTRLRVQARLQAAHGARTIWSGEQDVELSGDEEAPPRAKLKIPAPEQEGVYEIVLSATGRGLQERLTRRVIGGDERKVQLVVVARERPPDPPEAATTPILLYQIDPAAAAVGRLAVLPGLRRGPLGSGELTPLEHSLGLLAQLGPHGREPDISWQAYPLPVSRIGQPHILEVDYPSDVSQFLGISIIEPNAAGAVLPIGLDSGTYASGSGQRPARIEKHRLVFWPRTSAPLLLLTNRHDGERAVFGKIRLLGPRTPLTARVRDPGTHHLPRLGSFAAPDGSRLLAAYYDRPLFAENFGANQGVDPWSAAGGRTLHDWSTFFEGGSRLLEYLDYGGYNALVLSVMADGSTIYPSAALEPTPRYDDGTLFANGQDPLRKDVLEMMFRMCDRQGVRLIPAMHFSTPLAELEEIKRLGGGAARGLELVGSTGATWLQTHEPRQGLAPYYNPLNAQVQQAMLSAVHELAERYAEHPSFGGLALQLSADGYAQLPGAEWGCDDDTLVQFTREVNLGDLAGPPRELRGRLLTSSVRRHWLRWRAEKLAEFYGRLQSEVAAGHPQARLYLLGADMLNRPELLAGLRPDLNKPALMEDMLRSVGIDTSLYADDRGPTLVRVSRIGPERSLAQRAAAMELNNSQELDRLAGAADLFFHEPQEARVASFDAKSPFRPTYTRLVAQPLPAGQQNCQRFAHALATRDVRLMADGGWLLPLGEEDAVREFVQAYRELPPLPFQAVGGSTQPVAVRTAQSPSRTYLYLVNDSPWATTATLSIDAPDAARLERLVGFENAPPASGQWSVKLKPYGLVTAIFSAPGVQFSRPQVELSPEAAQSLDTRVKELWSRAATLKHPEPKDCLPNGDFELPQAADGSLVGWMVSDRAGTKAAMDDRQPRRGKQSLRLVAGGGGAQLASVAFVPPRTGRLSVSAWLRGAQGANGASVRMAVQGLGSGPSYLRYASLSDGGASGTLTEAWSQHVFQVHDLPEGLSGVSVHVELAAAGEVWVDDVQVFDLEFSDNERIELSKLIALAEYKRTSGEVADCLRILEGYWPRFLASYVPRSTMPLADHPLQAADKPGGDKPGGDKPATDTAAETAEPEHKPGMLDRVRRLVPDWWR